MTADRTWLVPRYGTFSALTNVSLGGDPAVARSAFGQGSTWFSALYHGKGTGTGSPVPPGYTGVAVLKFAAFQNGTDGLLDAVSGGLPGWVQAVQYDPESWDFTPPIEKGAWLYNPHPGVSHAELFCRKAHELGFPVVLSPSLDLCSNKPNPAYPGAKPQYPVAPGERNYEAYVRHRLASAARWLRPGDVYEFQSQALETDAGPLPVGDRCGRGPGTRREPGCDVPGRDRAHRGQLGRRHRRPAHSRGTGRGAPGGRLLAERG